MDGSTDLSRLPQVDALLRLQLVETRTFASGAELRSYAPAVPADAEVEVG